MIGTLLFVKKYAVILTIVGSLIAAGGAYAWLHKWSADRCTSKVENAVAEAERQAAKDRQRITEEFLRDQRGYEARLRVLRGQIDEVVNDNPVCVQPADVAGLLNSALRDPESPGGADGSPGAADPTP